MILIISLLFVLVLLLQMYKEGARTWLGIGTWVYCNLITHSLLDFSTMCMLNPDSDLEFKTVMAHVAYRRLHDITIDVSTLTGKTS